MISLDDHRRNIVVLEIALRELPSGVADTIRDIRSRLAAQGRSLVKHTLAAELVTVRRRRLDDTIG